MSQLVTIRASNNLLTKLPTELEQIGTLTELNLKGNLSLTKLPNNFASLSGRVNSLNLVDTGL